MKILDFMEQLSKSEVLKYFLKNEMGNFRSIKHLINYSSCFQFLMRPDRLIYSQFMETVLKQDIWMTSRSICNTFVYLLRPWMKLIIALTIPLTIYQYIKRKPQYKLRLYLVVDLWKMEKGITTLTSKVNFLITFLFFLVKIDFVKNV